ncbi:response regulator [Streptomyces sp. 4N124]|uniref:response regulator n=1 Tax=Streptomyces sp. 4N124 TaxID=3457420 RepID=UPI003FD2CC4E
MARPTLLVADDSPVLRTGLRTMFCERTGVTWVGEAVDGRAAVAACRRLHPSVVLMDVKMPVMDGLAATQEICSPGGVPGTRVVMLTVFDQDEIVFDALRAGACGFVLKDCPPEQIISAVRLAATGEALLSPRMTAQLIKEFARSPRRAEAGRDLEAALTSREREVFDCVMVGMHNDEIAARLSMSPSTVKSHVRHLCQKFGARDRVQLVIAGYEAGLVRTVRDVQDE